MSDNGCLYSLCLFFFFQAEDGIRDLVRSRGLGDVYKRQDKFIQEDQTVLSSKEKIGLDLFFSDRLSCSRCHSCLLYTSDAADERSSVDLGGRRIIKKKNT